MHTHYRFRIGFIRESYIIRLPGRHVHFHAWGWRPWRKQSQCNTMLRTYIRWLTTLKNTVSVHCGGSIHAYLRIQFFICHVQSMPLENAIQSFSKIMIKSTHGKFLSLQVTTLESTVSQYSAMPRLHTIMSCTCRWRPSRRRCSEPAHVTSRVYHLVDDDDDIFCCCCTYLLCACLWFPLLTRFVLFFFINLCCETVNSSWVSEV